MDTNQAVTIKAEIPQNSITLFGYTSPNSRVELGSSKAFSVTYSRDDGYFIFDHIILPRHPQDLCLTSLDDSHRPTNPVCIPEPPRINSYTEIGPILLPPTLSLDLQNQYTSGQSIPNIPLKIHLYQQSQPLKIAKIANAFSLPILETTTDDKGNFSLTIPNTVPTNYRLFATASFEDNNSPKSNTLLYHPEATISPLYFLIPLILIILSLFFIFKKTRRRFLPALIYNKTIALTTI